MAKIYCSFLIAMFAIWPAQMALANCSSPTGVEGELQWITSSNTMKVCDGTTWTSTVASADNSCATTTGTIDYKSTNGILGYCYGSTLYSMKGAVVNSCSGTTAGTFQYDSSLSTYKYCNGIDNNWYRMTTASSGSTFGYFVRTSTAFKGNHGGLSGANARCFTELTSGTIYWNGKDDAGTLTEDRVKAWICDGSNCQNPKANSTYKFAGASTTGPNTSTAGGASMPIDSNRQGPNDSNDWSGATYFGTAGTYWTARDAGTATNWATTSSATHCLTWTSSTNGNNAQNGLGSGTGTRWSNATSGCGSSLALVCMVYPDANPGTVSDCTGSCVEIFLTDTSASTWTVPANWNNANNKIEVIGGGAGGGIGITGTSGGGGGGGGGYAYATNVTLTPSSSVNVSIGISGTGGASPTAGGATWFGGTNLATSLVGVNGGSTTANATGGAGGTVVNGTGYSGGSGGNARASSGGSGGGGGGAAGPFGAGGSGAGPSATSSAPGGGGNGGGTGGTNASAIDSQYSGAGGSNIAYNGSGAGVSGTSSTSGGDGTVGGGGGGCTTAATAGVRGGHGSNGIEWTTKGSGGGGGAGCVGTNGAPGGNAGMFGGGGGGGASGSSSNGSGGTGSQGLIRITYTP